MYQKYTSWVLGALTLVGFGSSIETAKAQTTYPFNATYNGSSVLSKTITEDITTRIISGSSNDAPFGLTQASGLAYIKTDLSSGIYRLSSNPETFGLKNLPLGGITLFGKSNNKLFYQFETITGAINFENLTTSGTNINNITGGEGLFQGATGTLTGSEVYELANLLIDPTSVSKGIVKINGAINVPTSQKVPEPSTTAALLGISITGAAFLSRSARKRLST